MAPEYPIVQVPEIVGVFRMVPIFTFFKPKMKAWEWGNMGTFQLAKEVFHNNGQLLIGWAKHENYNRENIKPPQNWIFAISHYTVCLEVTPSAVHLDVVQWATTLTDLGCLWSHDDYVLVRHIWTELLDVVVQYPNLFFIVPSRRTVDQACVCVCVCTSNTLMRETRTAILFSFQLAIYLIGRSEWISCQDSIIYNSRRLQCYQLNWYTIYTQLDRL